MKALLFDVDGTLYRHGVLRRAMARRLVQCYWADPAEGLRVLRVLRAYRRGQELLRTACDPEMDLSEQQLRFACSQTGDSFEQVSSCVARWMEHEPLYDLRRALWPGVAETLRLAKQRGWLLGAVSDYPVQAKLQVLGIGDLFDIAVCAQDRAVQSFKPDPRGIEVALKRLGVSRPRAVYVGDRPDVDAVAAFRAAVPCIIIGQRHSSGQYPFTAMPDFAALATALATEFEQTSDPRCDTLCAGRLA